MNRTHKILVLILVVVGVSIFVFKFFELGSIGESEICPPDKCTYVITEGGSRNVSTSSPSSEGRTRQDFGNNLPARLPTKLPVDQKPIFILTSYTETTPATETEGGHSQTTYEYITSKMPSVVSADFEKYLKTEGYEIIVGKEGSDQQVYIIIGRKTSDDGGVKTSHSISVNTTQRNQVESTVLLSIITADISKDQ